MGEEEIMALLVMSHAACLLVGGSIGFLVAAICAMASDKGPQSHTEYGRATAVRQTAGHVRLIWLFRPLSPAKNP
jgi:hypothetical protein